MRIFNSKGYFKKMAIDLHTHSSASDGGFTPLKVVEYAKKIGLNCLSLTDHDTVQGLEEAQQRAAQIGMSFIPGIEFTTIWNDKELHTLGYFIDFKNPEVLSILSDAQKKIMERINLMIKKLNNIGYNITMEEVLKMANGASLGRPHIARTMVAKGYASSNQEVFDLYIGTRAPAYVQSNGMTTEESYNLIHKAGGITSLAHPGFLGRSEMMTEDDILIHKEIGLDAVEAFHSKHDNYMINYYLKIAKKFNMQITGGSDCHGSYYAKILMDRKFVPDWVAEKLFLYKQRHQ